MSDVLVPDRVGQLDFDRHDAPVCALDDEIHLVTAVAGPEVRDARLCRLRVGPDVEPDP